MIYQFTKRISLFMQARLKLTENLVENIQYQVESRISRNIKQNLSVKLTKDDRVFDAELPIEFHKLNTYCR